MKASFERSGFEVKKNLIPVSILEEVVSDLSLANSSIPTYGIRHADSKYSSIKKVASHPNIIQYAKTVLKVKPQIVRVIFFDKTPNKNWLVSWHQDKTIAVSKRFSCNGWNNWSIKEGVHHVQPPIEVLNSMVTFRIHLDVTNESNGCLWIIPESHRKGILNQEQINQIVKQEDAISCICDIGDTLVMKPHTLHCSKKATQPKHRRVIHIELSSYKLPENICWG
jgi:ectoine hydroxylase-related dioxygenase (phytanoyl-CoA dioxygenase family)